MKNKNLYCLQPKKLLHISLIDSVELNELVLGMGPFIDRVARLFLKIFNYLFKSKPVFSTREYAFGSYFSISFPKAKKSPLLRLLIENTIGEFKGIEILVKKGSDTEITDTDIESMLMGIKKKDNTVFIIVGSKELSKEEFYRLFLAFAHYQVLILPITEKDISRYEGWVMRNNISACLVSLIMLADKILLEGELSWWKEDYLCKRQISYIEERLDRMTDSLKDQSRTLIKKLTFIIQYVTAKCEIQETCNLIKISRGTYYSWLNNDPVFRNIMKS